MTVHDILNSILLKKIEDMTTVNKYVLITGGSRGIGLSIAKKFLQENHPVILIAQNEAYLNQLKKTLSETYTNVDIITLAIDLKNKSEIQQKLDVLFSDTSIQIEVLVNNAGIFSPGELMSEEEGVLEDMLAVNLLSAYHLTRKVVPNMRSHQSGHIFNISSVAGTQAYANGGSYGISKYALEGFSENLRFELRKEGIKVITVVPGAVWTDSWASSGLPEERFIKTEDIANMIYQAYSCSGNSMIERIVIRPQEGDI